ncbi:hypothetical protein AMAG_09519 [Allomyces macrogynus ATCC 38327]|uniref:RRM domain-containing protein n=1 Tax=Allomyces macrogynus (strain ATCC 38327) TaxID=578462 RepID=A0A0L0SQ57_ALLM3|nr:hypothetical protein AMAG_09519 [Allomyces macrogynus ATCC 38327]|eukprot:KNE64504.1 hypothetical protein AMAG_09519 [Allomyces macrogynus ATCC 38327]
MEALETPVSPKADTLARVDSGLPGMTPSGSSMHLPSSDAPRATIRAVPMPAAHSALRELMALLADEVQLAGPLLEIARESRRALDGGIPRSPMRACAAIPLNANGTPPASLFLANVPEVNRDEIKAYMERFGEVTMTDFLLDRGMVFIHFARAEDAVRAHSLLQGLTIHGHYVRVELANPPSDRGFDGPPSASAAGGMFRSGFGAAGFGPRRMQLPNGAYPGAVAMSTRAHINPARFADLQTPQPQQSRFADIAPLGQSPPPSAAQQFFAGMGAGAGASGVGFWDEFYGPGMGMGMGMDPYGAAAYQGGVAAANSGAAGGWAGAGQGGDDMMVEVDYYDDE